MPPTDITTAEDILRGEVQSDARGNLSHPIVKSVLILVPLMVGSLLLYLRVLNSGVSITSGARFTSNNIPISNVLLAVFLSVLIYCQSLDFREHARSKTLRYTLYLFFFNFFVLLASFSGDLSSYITNILGLGNIYTLLSNYLTLEDLLLFSFFFTAARGITLLDSMDVLRAGRVLLYDQWKDAYYTVVFTFFVAKTTVSRHVNDSWSRSRNMYRLTRRNRGKLKSIWTASRVFVGSLIRSLHGLAERTESILRERGFFRSESLHPVSNHLSAEDITALVALSFSFASCATLHFLAF